MIQKKNETLGTIMAVCGGICWGFSGCCGQFLFEAKGAKAPWQECETFSVKLTTIRSFYDKINIIRKAFYYGKTKETGSQS